MTHLLHETGERLWRLLGEEGAHLYVCGDAKMMAKDVRNIVREICQVSEGYMVPVSFTRHRGRISLSSTTLASILSLCDIVEVSVADPDPFFRIRIRPFRKFRIRPGSKTDNGSGLTVPVRVCYIYKKFNSKYSIYLCKMYHF